MGEMAGSETKRVKTSGPEGGSSETIGVAPGSRRTGLDLSLMAHSVSHALDLTTVHLPQHCL